LFKNIYLKILRIGWHAKDMYILNLTNHLEKQMRIERILDRVIEFYYS